MIDMLKLQTDNPLVFNQFARAIVAAVRRSLYSDALRGGALKVTDLEVRHRATIAARIVRDFYEGMSTNQYSIERICDELPNLLRDELDGKKAEPTAQRRMIWAPDEPEAPEPKPSGLIIVGA
jgi:hypothetical protein